MGTQAYSFIVIATIFYPNVTGLASPWTDGYNDHKSIERKRASPFMMSCYQHVIGNAPLTKHGYYKTLPIRTQG